MTYIVYDLFFEGLDEILKFVLKVGLKPKVIATPHLALIDIFELQVRFINLKNYVTEDVSKLLKTLNIERQFFPLRWNQQKMYDYIGNPPVLEDFFHFDDSEIEIGQKKEFVKKQKVPWCFLKSLKLYSEYCASLTCKIALSFLDQAFKTQSLLAKILKKQENFVHPFQAPLFTRAAYAYRTLLTFCPELSDVRVVKDPIPMQSSKSELEYCAFLRHQNPKHTFQDAWSPCGQKRFSESYPDSFSPSLETAFYFNGCLIHGHPIKQCLLNRNSSKKHNYFHVPLQEVHDQFWKKQENLKKNHCSVKKIVVQWECSWTLRRKTDPILQNFLANSYDYPPNHRLNVRASGNLLTFFCYCDTMFSLFHCLPFQCVEA